MSVLLSDLVSRLEADVPARNSVPDGDQYEQAIKDAVADFSNRVPLRKRTTLSIENGTATYNLPDDFLRVINLIPLLAHDNTLVTDQGLIPVSDIFAEEYAIAGSQITFFPTPTYTTDRYLWYAAAYVLDGGDTYQDMTDNVAAIIMLKAQADCLSLQGNVEAGQGWSYKFGDEAVDKKGRGKDFRDQVDTLTKKYLDAVKNMIGPVGHRSDYTWDVVASMP